jgi:glycosyltransferase involved in cell wall biosynthesis
MSFPDTQTLPDAEACELQGASVSVLIPAYKAARYITRTLESVAAQSVPPDEVIIFEDGLADDLAERVEAFSRNCAFPVRLIGSANNIGVSAARNRLIQKARGTVLAFLDADDIWERDHLESACAGFAAGADVCFSGVTFIDNADRPLPGASEPSADDLADMAPSVFRYNFVQCTSTLSLRRLWIDRVGDFDVRLSHGEDLDLWLRLLGAGARFHYTGRFSCRYRKHPQSAMHDTMRMVDRMGAFYEKHLDNGLIPRHQRREALISNRRILARLNWRSNPSKAAAAFARLAQLEPWNPIHAGFWLIARLRTQGTPFAQ